MRFHSLLHSIRGKLLLSISLLVGVIAIFVSLFFPARLKDQAMRTVEAKATAIRDMSAFSIASALIFDDSTATAQVVHNAANSRDVRLIVVRDSVGRLKAWRGDSAAIASLAFAGDSSFVTPDCR